MSAQSTQSKSMSDPPRGALLVVFLTVFLDLLGFGIVLPVMPRQAEPYLEILGLPQAGIGAMIGILFSVFSLMQFIFSPIWGRLSDRIGRRPLLILSLSGSVVFYALYGFAVTFPETQAAMAIALMLFARLGAGIAGASVGTAAAVIADCTPPERRARGMALIGIAFGAGFTLGPLIAYFGLSLFQGQPWGVGALASLLSFIALLIAVFIFKETRKPGVSNAKETASFSRMASVLGIPAVGALVLTYFLSIFAFANFEATLARLTKEFFAMNDDDNFLVFALIGVVLMIAGGLYRPLAKRLPENKLLASGIILMIIGLGGVGIVSAAVYQQGVIGNASTFMKNMFYAVSAVSVVGFAFVNPSISALLSKKASPDQQGEVLGVNQSFASLGRILGPFLGSVFFSLHDSRTLPFLMAVVVLVAVLFLLRRVSSVAASADPAL